MIDILRFAENNLPFCEEVVFRKFLTLSELASTDEIQ